MTELGDSLGELQRIVASADSADGEQLLWALTTLRLLRDELGSWEPLLITAARSAGASWAALAPALGVASRQAAERRYLRLRPSTSGETTGEARVAAERGRRAGDRAVASWARENSASLRQLAGQVSAVTGLDPAGTDSTGRVAAALGEQDPASLLEPLGDARGHLGAEHGGLAEQIAEVADHTDQLRRDAARGRDEK
jgi:hypothetical protein